MVKCITMSYVRAKKYADIHRQAFENPSQLGEVKKVATDEDGNFCILYSTGKWYHYRMNDGNLEWW